MKRVHAGCPFWSGVGLVNASLSWECRVPFICLKFPQLKLAGVVQLLGWLIDGG